MAASFNILCSERRRDSVSVHGSVTVTCSSS